MFCQAAAEQPWGGLVSQCQGVQGLRELGETGARLCHLGTLPCHVPGEGDTKKQQVLRSLSGDSLQAGTCLVQSSIGASPLTCKATGRELSGFSNKIFLFQGTQQEGSARTHMTWWFPPRCLAGVFSLPRFQSGCKQGSGRI